MASICKNFYNTLYLHVDESTSTNTDKPFKIIGSENLLQMSVASRIRFIPHPKCQNATYCQLVL